jgi:dTDP-glucose 4,6-dehydratase
MSIMVTGASGFLGREVCKLLEEKSIVVIRVDKVAGPETHTLNVCSSAFQDLVRSTKPVGIIHLAGVQYLKPVKPKNRTAFFRENVDMARTLAKVSSEVESVSHVVFVSTDMVYGKVPRSPVATSLEPKPIGPYGHSKLAAEQILADSININHPVLTIFRPRLIAGSGRLGTLSTLGRLISVNLPVPIFGSGLNRYQLVSKQDVAKAIWNSLNLRAAGVFNLGSDNPPTVRDLISSTIRSLHSHSLMLRIPNGPSLALLRFLDKFGMSPLSPEQFEIAGLDYVLDTSDTKARLQWEPTKSDFEILRESLSRD